MTIEFETHAKVGITFALCRGEISLDDLLSAVDRFLETARPAPPYRFVIDLRAVENFDATFRETVQLVSYLEGALLPLGAPVAFLLVAPQDPGRSKGHLFQLTARHISAFSITLHKTLTEAMQALGLPDNALPQSWRTAGARTGT